MIALIGNKETIVPIVQDDTVAQLLHYVCAAQFYACRNGSSPSLKISETTRSRLPPAMMRTLHEWETSCSSRFSKPKSIEETFATLQDISVKTTTSFQVYHMFLQY